MTTQPRIHQMRKIAGIFLCLFAASVVADDNTPLDIERLRQEILNLKHKIERLEKSRIPLNRTLEQEIQAQDEFVSDAVRQEPVAPWSERVRLNALVEAEASYSDTPEGTDTDLVVSAVELGVDAQLNDWMNGHVLVLYEQDATDPPEIDEAIITIANLEHSPWSLALGLQYVPFGNYDSHMVSDPLTLEIGETRVTAAQLGFVKGEFHALLYSFKGDTDDGIRSVGINFGISREARGGSLGYTLEASWINNLANSNGLRDLIKHPGHLEKQVDSLGIAASLSLKHWKFIGEYLGAVSDFDALDLSFNGHGARPQASNLEGAYHFYLFDKDVFAALAWQHSWEALALELPEDRYLATLGMEIHPNVSLALEYAYDQDYSPSAGGSGKNSNIFTLQLAASF
ncbi:LbtU family siderophore porin [Thiolapillus sp.]